MEIFQAAIPQVEPVRDTWAVAADVAVIFIALAILVVAAILVLLLLRVRSILEEMRLTVRQNLGPVSDRARTISDNVQSITGSLRGDVRRVDRSVKALTERLQQASDRMEERIQEFNALMEVVQSEAEELFLDTASTARGIREGTRSITNQRKKLDRSRNVASQHAEPASERSGASSGRSVDVYDPVPGDDVHR